MRLCKLVNPGSILALALFVATPAWGQKILILGDSLTEGYGVAQEQAFPALTQKILREEGFEKVEVVAAGISGSTTASGLSRLNWLLRGEPEILMLALGANDGLRGLSLEQTRQNLEAIVEKAKEADIRVLLAGMHLPPNYGEEYTRNFNAIFRDLAEKHQVALLPFLLEDVAGEASKNLDDGIHPNEAGHRVMAANVAKHLKEILDDSQGE